MRLALSTLRVYRPVPNAMILTACIWQIRDWKNAQPAMRKSKPGLISKKIRRTKEDLDGDGNTDESTYEEINGLLERELQAMVTYSVDVAKVQIGNSDVYPYWFADKNGNGTQEEDEKQYADWTPRLMYAAYNFKLVKTSAGYIHNPTYSAQLLIDSISDLAAGDSAISVDGIERP